jgi:hypothetical protein
MQMPLFEWTVVTGLARSPGSFGNRWTNEYAPPGSNKPAVLEDTKEPLAVLQQIQEMTGKAIYWIKDFASP